MRMLHLGLRVTDLERSLAFYTALGYAELGRVPDTPFGSLTMLQLPGDPFVSLELVHDPTRPVTRHRKPSTTSSSRPTTSTRRSPTSPPEGSRPNRRPSPHRGCGRPG